MITHRFTCSAAKPPQNGFYVQVVKMNFVLTEKKTDGTQRDGYPKTVHALGLKNYYIEDDPDVTEFYLGDLCYMDDYVYCTDCVHFHATEADETCDCGIELHLPSVFCAILPQKFFVQSKITAPQLQRLPSFATCNSMVEFLSL